MLYAGKNNPLKSFFKELSYLYLPGTMSSMSIFDITLRVT